MYVYINMKTTTKINQKSRERDQETERERENALMPVTDYRVCHSMAKRLVWAMKSWTALNINEFILFGGGEGGRFSTTSFALNIYELLFCTVFMYTRVLVSVSEIHVHV